MDRRGKTDSLVVVYTKIRPGSRADAERTSEWSRLKRACSMRLWIDIVVIASIFFVLEWCVPPVQAELSPHQVMIVANINSRDSLMVAEQYAARRGIPLQHIANLDLSLDDTMSREDYERKLLMPLCRLLRANGIQGTIRVLVTVYGVPLRVASPILTPEEQRWRLDA